MRTGYLRHTALALCVLMAAACQTPTPYGPAVSPNGDGYTTQQIESNRFRVSFKGNSLTTRQTVDTYMLYRAAEVTLEELSVRKARKATVGHGRASGLQLVPRTTTLKT